MRRDTRNYGKLDRRFFAEGGEVDGADIGPLPEQIGPSAVAHRVQPQASRENSWQRALALLAGALLHHVDSNRPQCRA